MGGHGEKMGRKLGKYWRDVVEENRTKMEGKWEKNEMKYPLFTTPFPPFSRRSKIFHTLPLVKISSPHSPTEYGNLCNSPTLSAKARVRMLAFLLIRKVPEQPWSLPHAKTWLPYQVRQPGPGPTHTPTKRLSMFKRHVRVQSWSRVRGVVKSRGYGPTLTPSHDREHPQGTMHKATQHRESARGD